ncbi:MAG: 4'-phosphopantetheinyl transferase superfamily protein [Clostridia bacterium]|nr:4'-phosphopantetheinyl transferase superfamily protein [Clostridia bacterium]
MIKVYILKTEDIRKCDFAELVNALPFGDAERQRLFAIGNSKHKWESLGGLEALARLCREMGMKGELDIERSPTGKPYFRSLPSTGFGISHSHGIAAAAVDTAGHGELGFDVEVINESYDFAGISNRFFTEDEKRLLDKKGNTSECFFRLWTAKEAQAKSDGRGLSALLGKDYAPADGIHLWQRIIETDGKRLCVALCRKNQIRSVKIYTDGEDSYEIQN